MQSRFGSAAYAMEELRAELASAFVASELGIPTDIPQHAGYIASWIKPLKDDKREIFRAAADAQRIADMELSVATGYAERETALTLLRRLPKSARRRTVGGDKGYDTRDFVAGCREIGVTPHVAQNTTHRRSAIAGRTTRHAGHVTSLRIRKRIEEPFGWMKTVAGGRKLRYIGLQRNRAWFLMTGAAYNLIRIAALDAAAG